MLGVDHGTLEIDLPRSFAFGIHTLHPFSPTIHPLIPPDFPAHTHPLPPRPPSPSRGLGRTTSFPAHHPLCRTRPDDPVGEMDLGVGETEGSVDLRRVEFDG